jgi:hypothetical protein
MEMPVDFDLSHFRERGYQVFRGIIPEKTIATVRSFLEQNVDRSLDLIEGMGVRARTPEAGADIQEILSAPDAKAIDRDARFALTGHFSREVRLDPILWEIPRVSALQRVIKEALGANALRVHMPATARFILPGNLEGGVPPHQDISYNGHMSDFLTIWAPLVPVDDRCGGVAVFEGSASEALPATPNNYEVWNEGLDIARFKATNCVPMLPGDVLMFNKLLIHKSMLNISEKTRLSVDYRFFRDTDTSSKHYLDTQAWRVIAPAADGKAGHVGT